MVTKVICKVDKDNNFLFVSIEDHSGYEEKGKDIVCSGISAITNGTINFLYAYYQKNCQIRELPTKITIFTNESDPYYQLCLRMMIYQLKNLSNSYPDYLRVYEKN